MYKFKIVTRYIKDEELVGCVMTLGNGECERQCVCELLVEGEGEEEGVIHSLDASVIDYVVQHKVPRPFCGRFVGEGKTPLKTAWERG